MTGKGDFAMRKVFFHFIYALLNLLLVLVVVGQIAAGAEIWTDLFSLESPDGTAWILLVETQPGSYGPPPEPLPLNLPTLWELLPPAANIPRAAVITGLPTREKVLALTIDDSPSWHTETLLAILAEKEVLATFFMDGSRSNAAPHRVRVIAQAGHDIANHTWSHPMLTRLSVEEVKLEISRASAAYIKAGANPKLWLRPPYGDYNAWVRVIAHELDHKILMWNLDSRDWQLSCPEEILERMLRGLRPGAIILVHDGPRVTPQVLPEFIDEARARGYRFVLISDYID
jgi:peptidoglycan/xylan/chitin deacetylase (PgdA/CDA1 family)